MFFENQKFHTCEAGNSAIQDAKDVAPELSVPPFTDVAYYLALRKFCESLWGAHGQLKLREPGKPTKTMYKDAMSALRFDSVQGNLGALAMRLCEVFSDSAAAPGKYGRGKRRRPSSQATSTPQPHSSEGFSGCASSSTRRSSSMRCRPA